MNAYYTGKRDPINCPANQPDPTRDYHDVPFPEGTQPKPTGEWTVYSVMKLRQKHWHEEDKNNAIAIAHNAALAVVHDERSGYIEEQHREIKALAGALAALEDRIRLQSAACDAALAKVKEGQ